MVVPNFWPVKVWQREKKYTPDPKELETKHARRGPTKGLAAKRTRLDFGAAASSDISPRRNVSWLTRTNNSEVTNAFAALYDDLAARSP